MCVQYSAKQSYLGSGEEEGVLFESLSNEIRLSRGGSLVGFDSWE